MGGNYDGWENYVPPARPAPQRKRAPVTKTGTTSDVPRFTTLKTTTRNLPCRLTESELLVRADDLSVVVQETTAEEGRQTDVKAQMKARLTELDAKKTRLAITIGRKEEYRDVEVEHIADLQAVTVTIYRKDTGESIETRPMTEQERQAKLPIDSAA